MYFIPLKTLINQTDFEQVVVCILQLFELGPDGGENEGDGEVLAESDEVVFECAARYIYNIDVEHWYIVKWYNLNEIHRAAPCLLTV